MFFHIKGTHCISKEISILGIYSYIGDETSEKHRTTKYSIMDASCKFLILFINLKNQHLKPVFDYIITFVYTRTVTHIPRVICAQKLDLIADFKISDEYKYKSYSDFVCQIQSIPIYC